MPQFGNLCHLSDAEGGLAINLGAGEEVPGILSVKEKQTSHASIWIWGQVAVRALNVARLRLWVLL